MRESNRMVKEWLLKNGYNDIWFKPHTKRKDVVYTQEGKYYATDLYNLFDGICYRGGLQFLLQNKTNSWAAVKPIEKFIQFHPQAQVLVFNVTNKKKENNGKYHVYLREYP